VVLVLVLALVLASLLSPFSGPQTDKSLICSKVGGYGVPEQDMAGLEETANTYG
jgi:hypothetical protein